MRYFRIIMILLTVGISVQGCGGGSSIGIAGGQTYVESDEDKTPSE